MPELHTFTVKAIQSNSGEWELEVLGAPNYGPRGGKDAHNEFFTPQTRFWLGDPHPLPSIHYHGLDRRNKTDVEPLGMAYPIRRDNEGQWFKVILNKGSKLARKMWEAAKEGFLRASSGALDYLVDVDEVTGEIRQWILGELSLMDSRENLPANDYAVALPALKSVYQRAGIDPLVLIPLTEPSTGGSSAKASGSAGSDDNLIYLSEVKMDEAQLMQMLQALLPQLVQMLQAEMVKAEGDGSPVDELEAAKANELDEEQVEEVAAKAFILLKKDSGVQAALRGDLDEGKAQRMVKAALDSRMDEIADIVGNTIADRRLKLADAAHKAAQKASQRVAQNTPAVAKSDAAGGVSVKTNGNGSVRITGGEDLRFAHMSAADMAVGIAMRTAPLLKAGLPYRLNDLLSEDYLRHAAGKAADWVETKAKGTSDYAAIKAVIPWKANELNATDIAAQGDEWVTTALGTSIWEKSRNTRMYREFMSRGMMEEEVPPGADSVDVPLEGNDPIAYSSPQANDLDATNRPEVTAKINPFATGKATLTPGEIKIATAYTVVFEENSIIRLAPQVNKQLTEKAEETVEQLILNGDTVTTASTNLNLIDDTPGTGISRPYYLASNGMLKFPIITSTTYSRSAGGALNITDYLNTRKKLPKEVRDRLDKLMFVVDSDTNMASLALPELTTQDVNRYATIEAGEILKLWGVPYFVSGFMELANSAGKVPAAGGTLGRILCVFPPYWKFAFRRGVTIETDRDILSGTNIYVASFVMGLAARGAGAASASYNVGVTIS